MANIYRNIFIRGLTELLGGQSASLRTRSGKKILAANPMRADRREDGETEETPQDALRKAATYASFAHTQEAYVNKARRSEATAYTIALTDWFEVPEVLEINVDTWTGKPGQTLRVKARDNFMVAGVTVIIRDMDDNVLEKGEAVQSKSGNTWWHYTTQAYVTMEPFPIVEAIARDLAGNQDTFVIS